MHGTGALCGHCMSPLGMAWHELAMPKHSGTEGSMAWTSGVRRGRGLRPCASSPSTSPDADAESQAQLTAWWMRGQAQLTDAGSDTMRIPLGGPFHRVLQCAGSGASPCSSILPSQVNRSPKRAKDRDPEGFMGPEAQCFVGPLAWWRALK